MELLAGGGDDGVGVAGLGEIRLDGDVVEVGEALLGDEASDDALERARSASHGDVVLLAGLRVGKDDVPVAELLVLELVLLELDAPECSGDGGVGQGLSVLGLVDDGTVGDAQVDLLGLA